MNKFRIQFGAGIVMLVVLGMVVARRSFHLASNTTNIKVDAEDAGRTFEGIGAVSAGASSRLLIDYPEPQRGEILDYLFKPNFGAGIQHLKVEIGGDVNSTDGCEPSHMHNREDQDYTRGYEWWLMKEAKRRNPGILLDCLAWGAPRWVGGGEFYSQDMADYIVKFIQAAQDVHGLQMDYTGIWNEVASDVSWVKRLRRTLDAGGLQHVKIVAADEAYRRGWAIADEMLKDRQLMEVIDAVGAHYPKFNSTPAAKILGKPLWSSEDGPWHDNWTGAMDLARIFNRNYVIGKITKTEVWSPVTAYYDNLPVPGSGIMRANSPWSGHYEVPPTVWITAHTTQFARPGWKYLEHACKLIPGGSVVALASPDGGDYSVVIETMDADHPQKLSFRVADAWANRPLHVWRTNAREYFKEIQSILPQNGAFTMAVDTQSVYSVTTAIGQCKGGALPPPAKPFPFPYREDFEGYEAGVTPRYLSDQAGIFEVVKRTDGTGMALLQVISEKGIEWPGHFNPAPESFLGSSDWRDYEISVDTLIEKAGFVSLFGRVGRIPQSFDPPDGYRLKVSENGEWQFDVVKNLSGKMQNPASTIGAGKVSFAADQWHRLKLRFSGDIIRVVIDNKPVAEIKDATYPAGMVGIGGGWHGAQFDNLTVSAVDEVSR